MATTTTTTPTQGYSVTPATAKILDALRATNDLYSLILDALGARYGEENADDKGGVYLDLCNEITERLHEEIVGQVIDALGDTANTSNPDVILI